MDNRRRLSRARHGADAKAARNDLEKMRVAKHGEDDAQHSLTYYAIVDKIAPKCAWLSMKPLTGRTHQLRVMMKALGSPIIGDARYGGTPSDRGYLHALQLTFDWRGENINVHCAPSSGELFHTLDEYLAHTHHA